MELRDLGITDRNTLSSIEKIPREIFMSKNLRDQAYENIALPIGFNQTISQPLIVALMTQNLELNKKYKVLELGTGCGYQTAILSKLSRRVYTIERIKELLDIAEKNLNILRITNVVTKYGDGNLGWIQQKPFDRIIITAATSKLSNEIIDQVRHNGIIIAPMIVDNNKQILTKFIKSHNKLVKKDITEVVFVPNIRDK